MPRVSQYLDPYLADTATDVRAGRAPLTPGSYLHYTLTGRAASYTDRYLRALLRALRTTPNVVPVRSRKGGIAYVRMDIPAPETIEARD